MPPAPPRFSTTNCDPSAAASGVDTSRAVKSTKPPGGNPTTTRTGFEGYPSAAVAWPATASANAATRTVNAFSNTSCISTPLKSDSGKTKGELHERFALYSILRRGDPVRRRVFGHRARLAAEDGAHRRPFPARRRDRHPGPAAREEIHREHGAELRGRQSQRRGG